MDRVTDLTTGLQIGLKPVNGYCIYRTWISIFAEDTRAKLARTADGPASHERRSGGPSEQERAYRVGAAGA